MMIPLTVILAAEMFAFGNGLIRFLVPVGNNGMAVYQLAKIGTAKLKTVLIGRSSMSQEHGFDLEVSEDDEDVAYLTLPRHPGSAPGVVKRSVSLRELVVEYDGPDVDLDFGEGNTLIGIEIVG